MTAPPNPASVCRPIICSALEVRARDLPAPKICDAYRGGATIAEIAVAHACSRPTIAKVLRVSGVTMRPARQRSGISAGDKNPAWRGGRRVRKDGYVLLWTPDGDRLEHRVVAERTLGRALLQDEIVHHLDGNKSNNEPTNLQVMRQSNHARHHAPEMHAARYGHDR